MLLVSNLSTVVKEIGNTFYCVTPIKDTGLLKSSLREVKASFLQLISQNFYWDIMDWVTAAVFGVSCVCVMGQTVSFSVLPFILQVPSYLFGSE